MIINFDGKRCKAVARICLPTLQRLPPAKRKLHKQTAGQSGNRTDSFRAQKIFLFSSTKKRSYLQLKMADLKDFFDKCNEVFHLSSKIPKEAREEDCILGIDEAGRGPVLGKRFKRQFEFRITNLFLGPMVYGAAYYPARLQNNLKGDKFQGKIKIKSHVAQVCLHFNFFLQIPRLSLKRIEMPCLRR